MVVRQLSREVAVAAGTGPISLSGSWELIVSARHQECRNMRYVATSSQESILLPQTMVGLGERMIS